MRRAREPTHILMKVETHNHPTAISPFPGAATGSGGEIRDEGATGRGAKPKAGLTGFTVSHLRMPALPQPWEAPYGKPDRIASALDIMLDGPIGGAAFNNEFGRPNLLGYFRTFEQEVARRGARLSQADHDRRRPRQHRAPSTRTKQPIPDGALLIQLGGPGMLIGLGGGAASSMATGANTEDLDFDSVQRGNAEIQRRAQEVIDRCWQLGDGQSDPVDPRRRRRRAVERAARAGPRRRRAARASTCARCRPRSRACRRARSGATRRRSATCSRSRRRTCDRFAAICERERCPFAVVGAATARRAARRRRSAFRQSAGRHGPRRAARQAAEDDARRARTSRARCRRSISPASTVEDAAYRVLQLPAVADKTFLVTIGDRTVGGLVLARSDGRPVAGAGRRCRGDADGLRRLSRRGDGDRRAHAARADRRAGVGPHGGRRGDHQHRRGGDRAARATSSCPRTGWRRPGIPARTPRSTTPCARWRWSCARRSASAFRSARTRCRCARRGATAARQGRDRAAVADRHGVRAGRRRRGAR